MINMQWRPELLFLGNLGLRFILLGSVSGVLCPLRARERTKAAAYEMAIFLKRMVVDISKAIAHDRGQMPLAQEFTRTVACAFRRKESSAL